ncbi:MAG: COG4223 family protein [Alphaproteobacteria bacterium]
MAQNPIKNAEAIIEAFGGIRPMAKKLDVAVTTVQGWKKRDAIPAARKDLLVSSAQEHGVDLTAFFADAEAIVLEAAPEQDVAVEAVETDIEAETKTRTADVTRAEKVVEEALVEPQAKPEIPPKAERVAPAVPRPAAAKSKDQTAFIWAAVAVILVLTIVLFGYLMLQPQEDTARIAALENELNAVQSELEETQEKQSFLGNLIPEDLDARLDALKTQAEDAQAGVQAAIEKSKEISNDVLAQDAGTLEERAAKLQAHASGVMASESLSGFMGRVDALKGDALGQAQVQQSLSALQSVLGASGLDGVSLPTADMNAVLEQARESDPALADTFAGVPQQDLKAAALLLGMAQFRSVLNRDMSAFDGDLALLNKLAGSDDPALSEALTRLAPHAQSGVLTPAGLSAEFKALAGDAVVASLSGEDVSLKDRAAARVNDVFQVEKDGELITGTETQATLAKTQNLLDQGDVAAAIGAAQGLDGAALKALAPWLSKAQGTLAAQDAKGALGAAITSVQDGSFGGGRLLQDKEAGINVYIPNSGNPAGALGDIIERGETLMQGSDRGQ